MSVGIQDNFVDVQRTKLTNLTDSKTYTQVTEVYFDIDRNIEKNQLSSGAVDNVYSRYMNGIEGIIILTVPQLADLITLTNTIDDALPVKLWNLELTDQSDNTITTTINGQLKTLRQIRNKGPGVMMFFFRIESDEALVVT